MVFEFAMAGLTWMFIIGFLVFTAYMLDDGPDYNSKAYRDLEDTILNRNEDV